MDAQEPLWVPSAERRERANLTRYAGWLARHRGVRVPEFDYNALWQWSVDQLDAFWDSIAEYFDVRWERAPETVLGSRTMPGAEWFPKSRVSFAEHVFRGKEDEAQALQAASELRDLDSWTWGRLRAETASIAAGPVIFDVTLNGFAMQRAHPDIVIGHWIHLQPERGAPALAEFRRCLDRGGFIGLAVSGSGGLPASDPAWQPFSVEIYLFVAVIYFMFCFAMSRYSRQLEQSRAAK